MPNKDGNGPKSGGGCGCGGGSKNIEIQGIKIGGCCGGSNHDNTAETTGGCCGGSGDEDGKCC